MADESRYVSIRFQPLVDDDADVKDVQMRVRRDLELGQVMDGYSKLVGMELDQLRFIGNGRQIRETQTPDDVGLRDGDPIHVVLRLRGCVCGCGLEPGHLLITSTDEKDLK